MGRTKDGKPDAWMPLYIGDTLADTAHLTPRQFGAYLRLRMQAWRRGGTLPGQVEQLRALTGLDPDQWRDDWPVLSSLFSLEDGLVRDPALEARYAHAVDRYNKLVANSAAAVAARAAKNAPPGAPDGVPNGTPDGIQNQNKNQKKPKSSLVPRTATRFDVFWAAYPQVGRKGKAEARKKWEARGLDAEAEVILADLAKRTTTDRQWLEGFVPHASTYVNGRGWEDAIDDRPVKAAAPALDRNGRPEPVHNPGGTSPPVVETAQRKYEAMIGYYQQQIDTGAMTREQAREEIRPYKEAADRERAS